ncbi:unnamed protein product [Clonostachys byssicola]|uniref:Uncharacterized protein n=1 Tax=Clonostachys byssicola TaxID=160290 RepID=A0A9N9U535_9HYPO|nr:unnamed protein product [Clonostachys byssicola]
MVAIKQIVLTGIAMLGMAQNVAAFAPAESSMALNRRYMDEDLPFEVRAVLDGSHPEVAVLNKRLFVGMALKAGRKVLGAGVKALTRHKRDVDDEMVMAVRDIMDDTPVVEFQVRAWDEDLPMEVRDVLEDSHPDLVMVNKRLFVGMALKAGRKVLGAGVKALTRH